MTDTGTDLADWLGRHGLDQYVQAFAENNIDYSVLPDLTENDLEKLGVTLGHRKKLLKAIGALTAARQPADTTIPVADITAAPPAIGQQREAELRQITVMFCDLVGSIRTGFRNAIRSLFLIGLQEFQGRDHFPSI